MTAHPCPCCAGTGQLDPANRPICATAIQRRDTRSPNQLDRATALKLAAGQRLALQGIAYDNNGQLLPEHHRPYIDYTTGEVRV